jgi:histone demethylase JARID1
MPNSSGKQKTSQPNGTQSTKPPSPLSSLTSAPLDLASVERRGQPTACPEPVKKKNRPHGLQEAPTYRPTEEEWKEPFEYIKKISPEARKYGLCKVIPPESWNPDFAIDTEVSGYGGRGAERRLPGIRTRQSAVLTTI